MSPGDRAIAKLVDAFLAKIEAVIDAHVRAKLVAIRKHGLAGLGSPLTASLPRRKGPKKGGRRPPRPAPPSPSSRPKRAPVPKPPAPEPPAAPASPPAAVVVPPVAPQQQTESASATVEDMGPALTQVVKLSEESAAKVLEMITDEGPVPPVPPALERLIAERKEAAANVVATTPMAFVGDDNGDPVAVAGADDDIPTVVIKRDAPAAPAPIVAIGDERVRVGEVWRRKRDGRRGTITEVGNIGPLERSVQYQRLDTGRKASVSLASLLALWVKEPAGISLEPVATEAKEKEVQAAPRASTGAVVFERPKVGQRWRRKDGSKETTVVQVEGSTFETCVVTILNRKTFGRPSMSLSDFVALWEPVPVTAGDFVPPSPAAIETAEEAAMAARMEAEQTAADNEAAALLEEGLAEARRSRGLVRELRVSEPEDEVFTPPAEPKASDSEPVKAAEPAEHVDFSEFDTGEPEVATSPATAETALVPYEEPALARYEVVDDDSPSAEVVERARMKAATGPDGRVRARTIAGRLTRSERRASALLVYPDDASRPQTREDCSNMPRPCPFVSCSHHLYLDVNDESGAVKLNFPHLEVWEMKESCSLDVADRGGITLEEVGAILNLTRERIRQVETRGIHKIRQQSGEALGISDGGYPEIRYSPLAEEIEGASQASQTMMRRREKRLLKAVPKEEGGGSVDAAELDELEEAVPDAIDPDWSFRGRPSD